MSWEILTIALLIALGWFWLSSLRYASMRLQQVGWLAQKNGVQFLDETVALKRITFAGKPSY